MSKKTPLEESFNLPPLSDIENSTDEDFDTEYHDLDEVDDAEELTDEEYMARLADFQKSFASLKSTPIDPTESADQHLVQYLENMNTVHEKAMENFEELITSIMSMEAAHGAKFLVGATKLLDIAKDSQNTSMDRVIRMTKLKMDYEKHRADLDGLVKKPKSLNDKGQIVEDGDSPEDDETVYKADRNKLLERLREEKNK